MAPNYAAGGGFASCLREVRALNVNPSDPSELIHAELVIHDEETEGRMGPRSNINPLLNG